MQQFLEVIMQSQKDEELSSYLSFFEKLAGNQNLPMKLEDPSNLLQQQENRMPQLNPLLQAALGERLQFDKDIPELRTQFLPPDKVTPAIPVRTTSLDLTQITLELEKASNKTKLIMEKRFKELEQKVENGSLPVKIEETTDLVKFYSDYVEPSVYKTGHLAKLVSPQKVSLLEEKVTPSALDNSIFSSQGRKSACYSLTHHLKEFFKEKNFSVVEKKLDVKEDFLIEWKFDFYGGLNPKFSLLQNVLQQFKKKVQSLGLQSFTFYVADNSILEDRVFSFALYVWNDNVDKKSLDICSKWWG